MALIRYNAVIKSHSFMYLIYFGSTKTSNLQITANHKKLCNTFIQRVKIEDNLNLN